MTNDIAEVRGRLKAFADLMTDDVNVDAVLAIYPDGPADLRADLRALDAAYDAVVEERDRLKADFNDLLAERAHWKGTASIRNQLLGEEVARAEKAEASLAKWDGVHKAVAELTGQDPETWPEHGNAPLAITAGYALAVRRAEAAEARLAEVVAVLEPFADFAASYEDERPEWPLFEVHDITVAHLRAARALLNSIKGGA